MQIKRAVWFENAVKFNDTRSHHREIGKQFAVTQKQQDT
jgi:hypothetical protein